MDGAVDRTGRSGPPAVGDPRPTTPSDASHREGQPQVDDEDTPPGGMAVPVTPQSVPGNPATSRSTAHRSGGDSSGTGGEVPDWGPAVTLSSMPMTMAPGPAQVLDLPRKHGTEDMPRDLPPSKRAARPKSRKGRGGTRRLTLDMDDGTPPDATRPPHRQVSPSSPSTGDRRSRHRPTPPTSATSRRRAAWAHTPSPRARRGNARTPTSASGMDTTTAYSPRTLSSTRRSSGSPRRPATSHGRRHSGKSMRRVPTWYRTPEADAEASQRRMMGAIRAFERQTSFRTRPRTAGSSRSRGVMSAARESATMAMALQIYNRRLLGPRKKLAPRCVPLCGSCCVVLPCGSV